MSIRIFNSMSGTKEPFQPVEPGKIRMYVCGPTVYDFSHIGHARSVVVFDVIARYLKAVDYDVVYIRNFTDVDDKIIQRASETNTDPAELAEKFIREFTEDMTQLNVQPATVEPKVTEFIPQIISFVTRLIEKGYAYQVDGDVFFEVNTFDGYGKLSGRKLDDMEAGARVKVDERKKNPFDFALWKSAKPGEPFWDSPWGKGRPGWHIECSAMSSELLGETFDIHGGGKDLIFPHHENEIAQSEGAFGKSFANYWVHNGFVNIEQEKMSKSLGNFLLIKDVIRSYHPEAVRLFLLSSHYRSPIDFSEQAMIEATSRLDRLYGFLLRAEDRLGPISHQGEDLETSRYWTAFREAMDDDFNTALGLAVIFDAVRRLNGLLESTELELVSDEMKALKNGRSEILKMGNEILGILTLPPATYFEAQRLRGLSQQSIDSDTVEKLIEERTQARKSKNWKRADEIRTDLESMGIILEDRPDGTRWKFKS